jgi:hypothetical protein
MFEILLDSLLDSIKVIWFVFFFYVILSFVEGKLTRLLTNRKNLSPLIGSSIGLIPQCGISVVSANLYIKNKISLGTIIAIFIVCSDEAIPIILSQPKLGLVALKIILIKFIIGLVVGYLIDLLYKEKQEGMPFDIKNEIHVGCCKHKIEDEKEMKIKKHLLHPLIHSLKIFIYIFIIYFMFGTMVYFIGEDVIINFLESSKYLTPIYATVIGLIPNCASSVILSNMYVLGQLSFGTIISGLIANTGLGLAVLLKNKNMVKKTLIIIGILLVVSITSGYILNLMFGF